MDRCVMREVVEQWSRQFWTSTRNGIPWDHERSTFITQKLRMDTRPRVFQRAAMRITILEWRWRLTIPLCSHEISLAEWFFQSLLITHRNGSEIGFDNMQCGLLIVFLNLNAEILLTWMEWLTWMAMISTRVGIWPDWTRINVLPYGVEIFPRSFSNWVPALLELLLCRIELDAILCLIFW